MRHVERMGGEQIFIQCFRGETQRFTKPMRKWNNNNKTCVNEIRCELDSSGSEYRAAGRLC